MATSNNRKETLTALLNLQVSIHTIKRELSQHGWDSESELVLLNNAMMSHVLHKYLRKEVDAEMIEEWANVIECRDDIGFENEHLGRIQA